MCAMAADASELKIKVLLVEDHDALREVVSETLERYACQVTGVDCAEAVCELPHSELFDVAVLDLNLPGEDGLVLAERLRAAQPALGIVMMTARREREDRLQGYQHGADVYLSKPVDADELALAVQALARRIRLAPEILESGFWLDHQALSLVMGHQRIPLTPDEAAILHALAVATDSTMAGWQLLGLLGREVDETGKNQLQVIISRLRNKSKSQGLTTPLIRAVRGTGYRLCVPLQLR